MILLVPIFISLENINNAELRLKNCLSSFGDQSPTQELAHLEREYFAEEKALEAQLLNFTVSEEEQDRQIQALRAQIEALPPPQGSRQRPGLKFKLFLFSVIRCTNGDHFDALA